MAAIFTIRRGTGSIDLQDGELYLNKGKGSIQFGSGSGNEITLLPLDAPVIGDIKLQGDITASNAFFSGDVAISGNLFLGNQTSDTITATGEFQSNLIPNPDKTWDLGSDSKWWRSLYVNTISSSVISGSIAGVGNIEEFSASIDERVDRLEASSSLYDNAMSGSLRLYVSPEGSDTNDGSDPSVPFKTIKAAVESLGDAVFGNVKRYTIFVGSGNYTEQNPIAVPPGVSIVGDTLRTVRLTAANPEKDFFHCHDSNYFYGLRFLDLKHPAFAFSFPCSTAKATISGAGVVTGLQMVHTETGYQDGEEVKVIIEGPDAGGTAATATATVSGGNLSINIVDTGAGYDVNEKPHVSIQAPLSKRPVITTSPYIQNCSSITGPFNTSGVKVFQALPYDEVAFNIDEQGAGGGIRIDGNLVHPDSPLESFVADAFTQVNQGGPGHLVINKGYAQFVSCFTTFCTYGFKTANGGFANISNSVIDFGKEGLISKTYFPTTYNTGSSLETKTSTVSGFIIDENGAGYTGSIAGVTISGGGASVDATAEATVNANGSIEEIVLLTPGSGYTSEPTVVIDTPTGPGAIQATTVSGKALISGVSEMLISLESGSRGIDISSNMILDGVDYLVTDVTKVTGQPNQRRVTTYPAPPSITTGDNIKFHQLSNISTGGLVMEYVGSGVTYNALPKYGGVPIRTREIIEYAPGRVFYSTVDNIGNLKIGDFFSVNQLTGELTINANSFNLSGLNAIGPFKRNGVAVGVVLQEVSNNTTLLNSQGLYGEDTVPTQFAVKGYIDPISASVDARLDVVESVTEYLNGIFSSSVDSRLDELEATSSYLNTTFSTSVDSRLDVLETAASSDNGRLDALEDYTSSLNTAIQLTGSTVSFLGNIVVYGTQSIINSENLAVADNIIYLNHDSFTTNPDLGIVGNYNDGTYAHTGIYRDSADGIWRIFDGYVPEPSGTIDLAEPTFKYADFYVNEISASSLVGIGNVTEYSTSVDARLKIVEASASLYEGFSTSVDSRLDEVEVTASYLNTTFSTSVDSRLDYLEIHTGSVNDRFITIASVTASISSSLHNLNQFSSSQLQKDLTLSLVTASYNDRWDTLAIYSGSVDTKFTTISQVTESLFAFTQSQEQKDSTLQIWTSSVDSRLDNLERTSQSVNEHISDINNWSASINSKNDTLALYTSSVNSFTASATASIIELFWTASDHEERLDYIEGVAFGGLDLNAQFQALENVTASLQQATASLQLFTQSANVRLINLEIHSESVNLFTQSYFVDSASVDIRLDNLESFTGSLDVTYVTQIELAAATGALENSIATKLNTSSFNAFTQSYQTDSSSFDSRLDNLESFTASLDTTYVTQIELAAATGALENSIATKLNTSSFNSYTQSTDNRLNVLEVDTTNLEAFTSSINTTIKNRLNVEGVISGSSQVLGGTNIHSGSTGNYQFNSIGVGMAATGVAGEIVASADIIAFASSDIRLKENIVPIPNALEKVNQISGNTYDWKAGYDEVHSHKGNDVGVIAQEIEQILPQIVTNRDTGFKAVQYEKIIPLLIEAIKELSAKVDRLENK